MAFLCPVTLCANEVPHSGLVRQKRIYLALSPTKNRRLYCTADCVVENQKRSLRVQAKMDVF